MAEIGEEMLDLGSVVWLAGYGLARWMHLVAWTAIWARPDSCHVGVGLFYFVCIDLILLAVCVSVMFRWHVRFESSMNDSSNGFYGRHYLVSCIPFI